MKRGFLNRPNALGTKATTAGTPTLSSTVPAKEGKDNAVSSSENRELKPDKPSIETKPDVRKTAAKDIPFQLGTVIEVETSIEAVWQKLDRMGISEGPATSIRMCAVRIPNTQKSKIFCSWLIHSDLMKQFPAAYDWGPLDAPTPLPRPYRISPSPNAGLGMFATRNIAMAETIVVERPVIMIPLVFPGGSQINSTEEQRRVNGLSNCKAKTGQSELSGKIMTNTLKCNFPQSYAFPTYAGICLEIARCNHSCGPNAVWAFNSKNLHMELRASRDIAANEEITISYISKLQSRAKRRAELESAYGFICKCAYCAVPPSASKKSDELREKIRTTVCNAEKTWRKWIGNPEQPWSKFIDTLEKCSLCLGREGLSEYRADLDRYIAAAYAVIGDENKFKKWAESAARTERIIEIDGHGYLTGEDWVRWLGDPTSIPCWGQRKK
ncbi:hypothetical protein DFH11DRAFT_1595718 [Phellopilus nigrolimitatus]|nr:hypothetical protein DFH11DRAFT_1595718 [Phellopilus nigrolimitatus]